MIWLLNSYLIGVAMKKIFLRIKILFVLLLLFLIFGFNSYGQLQVPYLNINPVIDGEADTNLPASGKHNFSVVEKSDELNADVPVSYYLGYSANYLYLYIEAVADSIINRDRAYQNGDGFHLTLCRTTPGGEPTNEFYVLAFSPEKTWCHKMIWYYNKDLSMAMLPDEVKFETHADNHKIAFELLIPWKIVKPYHPWINDSIGFNLCFVKALGENGMNYYFATDDEKMQSEQSERKYLKMIFQKPDRENDVFISPQKYHLSSSEKPELIVASMTGKDTILHLIARVISSDSLSRPDQRITVNISKNRNKQLLELKPFNLSPGAFNLEIFSNNQPVGKWAMTQLPHFNFDKIQKNLADLKPGISIGTFNTLSFLADNAKQTYKHLKPYETANSLVKSINNINTAIDSLEQGTDIISGIRGTYRRAFRSQIDSSLRPYSIYVPADYNQALAYPLLVYLHGSGDDDRVLKQTPKIEKGFIIVAPNGRGTSNCFAGKEPQTDIMESINDVVANFNIDTTKIILSGFSMGGYGVYRTFYEHPDVFSSIAVLSGHPNLAQKWIGPDEIDFTQEKNLASFTQIPVYIFHGKEDMNCPYEITAKLANCLKQMGCKVIFVTDSTGHGNMTPRAREEYFNWLREQVK